MFEAIVDTLPCMIAFWDKELKCRFANKAYIDWFGKDPNALKGMPLAELLGPHLFKLNEPHILGALAGFPQTFQRTLMKADGSVGHTLAHYVPQFDTAGKVLGFSALVTDITSLKKDESAERLAASVYDNITEAIVIQTPDEKIISVNRAFSDITGYEREEVIGRTTRILGGDRDDELFRVDVVADMQRKGFWEGELWSRRKNGQIFLAKQTSTIIPGDPIRYVSVFSDVTERWNAYNKQRHLALHDALTDLPNRLLLLDRIETFIKKAASASGRFSIIFIDLDGFKAVNDNYGHAAGDDIIKIVSQILLREVRVSDTVARLGGDEFVIALDPPIEQVHIQTMASRIIAAIRQPIQMGDSFVQIGASAGVSFFPDHGETPVHLLQAADSAMYTAKKRGKNTYYILE